MIPQSRVGRLLALLGFVALSWGAAANGARAQAQGCATCATSCSSGSCQRRDCPPWFHHCQERPPVICIKCGCPRPVCNPCILPNFGYFQTCWTPWPLPPDWGHCPVTPPAAYVQLGQPAAVPGIPSTAPTQKLRPAPSTGLDFTPLPKGSGQSGAAPGIEQNESFPDPSIAVPAPGTTKPGR
jgi:hypothetical protein